MVWDVCEVIDYLINEDLVPDPLWSQRGPGNVQFGLQDLR